ncbi:MAG: GAF domain-containing protein, partial [Planctomycetaceae bacterium]|nr:GAF domain-containing protein [Planctomycetaceae bacterium]
MVNPSANQLRIHVEDPWTPATGLDLPAWHRLTDAYCRLTGWQLQCSMDTETVPPRADGLGDIPELFGGHAGHLYRIKSNSATESSVPAEGTEAGRDLAEALVHVFGELQETRRTLQHREAELATAIPVTSRGYDAANFNHRLQAVLRGTVEILKGSAAALYLLDDATSELKLRAQWGLPSLRFLQPARPLRGAVADLEALTGHAVVLQDAQLQSHWNVPENYASAVCIPVASPESLLGTLWFYADEVRDYSDADTQLLEIIAGRLAVELERRVLLQEAHRSTEDRELATQVEAWHQERALLTPPRINGWQVAATTVESGRMRGDFHCWRIDQQDRLWLASAAMAGPPVKCTLSATLLQGAVQAALASSISAEQILHTVNDVLWASSTGHDGASMFCGAIE